jgi:hypothetical protein
MKQALRRRHDQQRADLPAAARLAEDRDVGGIAAKRGDVVAHPFERGDHVERAGIARPGETLAADVVEMQVATDVEPVVDADHHDIAAPREVGAVGDRAVAGAIGKGTAVQPHHHRPFSCETWRPDIEAQAVLGFRAAVDRPENAIHLGAPFDLRRRLRRLAVIDERVVHPGPRRHRLRRSEAVRSAGRCAIGNALEGMDAACHRAADFPGSCLDDRRQAYFIGHGHSPFPCSSLRGGAADEAISLGRG